MRMTKSHKGRRLRKPHWAKDEWVRLRYFGEIWIVIKDESDREIAQVRNDNEEDWELLALDDSDMEFIPQK